MMVKFVLILLLSLVVSGCASLPSKPAILEAPKVQMSPLAKQLSELPAIDGARMTIAVYGFADKTGQRKTADAYATFSSAVTQGAESWLIDALRLAGNGVWFQVLERASLDLTLTISLNSLKQTGNFIPCSAPIIERLRLNDTSLTGFLWWGEPMYCSSILQHNLLGVLHGVPTSKK